MCPISFSSRPGQIGDSVLDQKDTLDPATTRRTFSVIANDYLTMTFL